MGMEAFMLEKDTKKGLARAAGEGEPKRSDWSTRGVPHGKTEKRRDPLNMERAKYWHTRLVESLRMTYETDVEDMTPTGIRRGAKVIAHPEFDREVEAAMYRELPRRLANYVYNSAIKDAKPKADKMLKDFEDSQEATNRPAFKNALKRFATFAPDVAAQIGSTFRHRRVDGGRKTRRRGGRKRTIRK